MSTAIDFIDLWPDKVLISCSSNSKLFTFETNQAEFIEIVKLRLLWLNDILAYRTHGLEISTPYFHFYIYVPVLGQQFCNKRDEKRASWYFCVELLRIPLFYLCEIEFRCWPKTDVIGENPKEGSYYQTVPSWKWQLQADKTSQFATRANILLLYFYCVTSEIF